MKKLKGRVSKTKWSRNETNWKKKTCFRLNRGVSKTKWSRNEKNWKQKFSSKSSCDHSAPVSFAFWPFFMRGVEKRLRAPSGTMVTYELDAPTSWAGQSKSDVTNKKTLFLLCRRPRVSKLFEYKYVSQQVSNVFHSGCVPRSIPRSFCRWDECVPGASTTFVQTCDDGLRCSNDFMWEQQKQIVVCAESDCWVWLLQQSDWVKCVPGTE